jgi:hypothetical protein
MLLRKRWYELALGVALLATGLALLLVPGIGLWILVQHEYMVGLSVNSPQKVLTLISVVLSAVGIVVVLGGAALLRRQ